MLFETNIFFPPFQNHTNSIRSVCKYSRICLFTNNLVLSFVRKRKPSKKTKQNNAKNETKTLLCLVRIEMYLRYSHAKEPLDVVGLEFCRLLMLLCFVYSPTSFFNVIASQFSHSFDDIAFHAETDATLCIHHHVMTANSEILPLYFDFILFSNLQLLLCSKSVLII